jgi:23S rRNA (pseudouridine1915-N3)-methyltransferase
MKFQFWSVGKVHESYVREGVDLFTQRISRYFPVTWHILPLPKNAGMMSEMDLMKKEGDMILDLLKPDDYLVLLDERGKQMKSEMLAQFLEEKMMERKKQIIFLIGGAYGVSKEIIQRADFKWSLSELVFPHQLVRLILSEQIYRACTIMRNEKYHHE